jgi:hypothetical protein
MTVASGPHTDALNPETCVHIDLDAALSPPRGRGGQGWRGGEGRGWIQQASQAGAWAQRPPWLGQIAAVDQKLHDHARQWMDRGGSSWNTMQSRENPHGPLPSPLLPWQSRAAWKSGVMQTGNSQSSRDAEEFAGQGQNQFNLNSPIDVNRLISLLGSTSVLPNLPSGCSANQCSLVALYLLIEPQRAMPL